MNIFYQKRLHILSFFICLASQAFSQTDTLVNVQTEDSMVVVVPEQVEADLNMIKAPAGFVASDRFNGYIHYQASSGIIMTMIENSNYVNLEKGMTDEFFEANGLTLVKKEDVKSDNGAVGVMYKCSFILQEMNFVRYIVYAGDLNRTLWLNITYPEKFEGLVEEEILKSIKSINLNPLQNEK